LRPGAQALILQGSYMRVLAFFPAKLKDPVKLYRFSFNVPFLELQAPKKVIIYENQYK
jgi:hypothetical protein